MLFDPESEPAAVELCDLGTDIVSFPALSRDGSILSYIVRGSEPGSEAFIVTRDITRIGVSAPRRLCSTGMHEASSPAWHPDANRIYFSIHYDDSRRCEEAICWIDADGARSAAPIRIVGRPGQTFRKPHISPDGRSMCFTHYPGYSQATELEVWRARINESGDKAFRPERLTRNDLSDDCCRYSRDGDWIYHSAEMMGRALFFRTKTDGSAREIVYTNSADRACRTDWFSLSRSGLLACHLKLKDDTIHILVADPDGPAEKVLSPADLAPGWDMLMWPCFFEPPA
jgi:Tol biopolymer transport system component